MSHLKCRYLIEHEDSSQIIIRDLGPWDKHMTVTNDVETVVSELAPTIGKKRIFYHDSIGGYDEILHHEGRFVRFAPGPSRGFWATREGSLLRIRAMSDSHLENAIKFMERHSRRRARAEAFLADCYAETAPDGAADAAMEASREMYQMADDPDQDLKALAELVFPKYIELKQEQQRRA